MSLESVRESYGKDLKRRGWTSAYKEYMSQTAETESTKDIYNIYKNIYNQKVHGKTAAASVIPVTEDMSKVESTRQSYGNDLAVRGWNDAYAEYMRLTEGLESSADIYDVYMAIYKAWIKGGPAVDTVKAVSSPAGITSGLTAGQSSVAAANQTKLREINQAVANAAAADAAAAAATNASTGAGAGFDWGKWAPALIPSGLLLLMLIMPSSGGRK